MHIKWNISTTEKWGFFYKVEDYRAEKDMLEKQKVIKILCGVCYYRKWNTGEK